MLLTHDSFLGFPTISIQTLKFFETLTTFYHNRHQDINSDESSDEVNCDIATLCTIVKI